MLDSRPVAIDRIRVPLTVAPTLVDQDFTDASIYATLEAAGAAPVRADMVASATTADDSCAATLGVENGAPLLVCTTMWFDDADSTCRDRRDHLPSGPLPTARDTGATPNERPDHQG